MDLFTWIPTGVLAFALFLARNWIKAGIEKSVHHKFETKLETLRAALRDKEAEIATLRNAVISGRANRQALVEKRRLDAVERVWTAVNALASLKFISASMAIIKFDAASKEAAKNPQFRKFFEMLVGRIPADKLPDNPAKNEQLFVSPIAWAYFSAYQAIVYSAYMKAKILEMGIERGGELISSENVVNLLKAALPDMKGFIDEHKTDTSVFYYFLDALEERLLAELQRMLKGEEIDETSLAQSIKIMKAVGRIKADSAEVAKAGNT